ncbi:MAG TPA: C4-type zinc ribbon domain-containing protein [Candidatus Limnocylindrales bacterium]|nr:C4-type zinc ribbon domain-containing protein [Candidatus Limnocylindrales bacterium]
MTSQLESLFRLQAIDTRLLEKQRTVEKYEAELAERRKAMDAVQARIDGLSATRKDLVSQRALAERKVADLQESLKQRRQRLQKVRNERELRAGQDEITSIQEEIREAETRQLDLMQKVEDLEASIETAKAEFADLESADHRHIGDAAERIDGLRRELEGERAARNQMADGIEAGLRKKYEMILSRRYGLAVVEVDAAGCCVGCHVQIPPQTLIEVRKTSAVRVCPMCQRILFLGGDGSAPVEPA